MGRGKIELAVGKAYGGDQSWWGKGSQGERYGCGVVAGANVLWHLGHGEGRASLLPAPGKGKQAYMLLADSLWREVMPWTGWTPQHWTGRKTDPRSPAVKGGLGVPGVGRLEKGMLAYGRKRGVPLRVERMDNRSSLEEAKAFLDRHLDLGRLPCLLTWAGAPRFSWHWVCITDMGKAPEGALEISTWGRRESIPDFRRQWEGKGPLDKRFLAVFYTSLMQSTES
ncbi:hypothetical protein [Anaerotalea alkaliphila]|uniref:hypothetical protein n=1 Tax=Anaerotalea alkaliphila TaxID=2662126 RepID=UPI001BAE34B1|nr:hypothetical protein [Anaerotalea alkaliphila]